MNTNPLLQHPSRYVWDFWYHYQPHKKVFHLFYLNAELNLVKNNQHHFSSCVGYATTHDFQSIYWHKHDVLCARKESWDNTSIWTGDIVSTKNGFTMFYTSRNSNVDDGCTQEIGIAHSKNFTQWTRLDSPITRSSPEYYETKSIQGENSIHAWRDPFIFQYKNSTYMLVAAKDKTAPKNRKGAIALLKAKSDSMKDWQVLPPLYSPNLYSECEVPRIYQRDGELLLTFSCKAQFDFSLHLKKGGLYWVKLDGIEQTTTREARSIFGESSNLYAGILIPELRGAVVGFDAKSGGLQRLDFEQERQDSWIYLPRKFC